MPALKELNGVRRGLTQERWVEKKIQKVMKNIWMYTGCYRIAAGNKMDESSIWYVCDEVGSALAHSDKPNCQMLPFIYSPKNSLEDETTITYSILWPIEDIEKNGIFSRDKLYRIDEKKFRSARLSVWYETPEEYFKEQLKLYREGSKGMSDAH